MRDANSSASDRSPTLSILTPVYNAAAFLPRLFASFDRLAPEHRKRTQLVLVDDGSTDDSAQALDRFANDRHADFAEITVLRQPNGGSASARNTGLDHATATWLLFLDADDELTHDPLPDLDAARPDHSCVLYAAEFVRDARVIRRHRPPHIARDPLDTFTAENPLLTSSIAFRRALATHRLNEQIISREDWLFWIENRDVLANPLDRRRTTLSRIHIHGSNKSADHARAGRFRAQIAERLLDDPTLSLTPRQRNNLRLQAACGHAVNGLRPALKHFARFPCDSRLYAKFLVYALFGPRIGRVDAYSAERPAGSSTKCS
ncbi:MAG: glycosyltransferase family 2 protein [Planctomycetota bacterium]